MNEFLYTLVIPGIVEIQDEIKTIRLNEENVKTAIKNVKQRREDYTTEVAYQRQLSKYQGALQFLQTNVKQCVGVLELSKTVRFGGLKKLQDYNK